MALVEYEKKSDHIAVIAMNRPEKLNAIDYDMLTALRDAWIRYRDDDEAWIAIFTGRGSAFSAGADKSWFEMSLRGQASPDVFLKAISKDPYWSGQLEKPVLTAINGPAVGAGLDLVLRSDLRIAGENVWFQQAEVERGSFMVFHDNMPYAMAAEMISGFRIGAKRAYDVGMVNRLVPDDKVMDAALEMAEQLLSRVPLAVYHALKTIRDMKGAGPAVPWKMVNHYTTVLSNHLMQTEDFKEATAAMIEKRDPVFKRQ